MLKRDTNTLVIVVSLQYYSNLSIQRWTWNRDCRGVSFHIETQEKGTSVGVYQMPKFEKQQFTSPHLRVLEFLFQSS